MPAQHLSTLGALASVALAACTPSGVPAEGGRPGATFDPDHVLEIDLEMAAGDWQTLRTQSRSWLDVYRPCLGEPFGSPFTSFPARVAIDGERADRVSVRKRGFLGSLSTDKPSLKIALGDSDVLLNNAVEDPSYVRQCLAYGTFSAAGVAAPRCNFARVRVNGEDLGLYVHVERVDRAFVAGEGNLYEGTYSDFRAGWTATFEPEQGDDAADIDAVVAALERPDAELLPALGAVVDLEQLFTFWAAEVLVGHRDGFAGNANNYFAYRDPDSDRFQLIPWGTDSTFLPGPDPLASGTPAAAAGSQAPWRLYHLPEGRARYFERLRRLLDQVWNEADLLAEIDRMETVIALHVGADPAASLDEVRGFVRNRRAALLTAIDTDAAWTPTLTEMPCLVTIGELRGSLSTHWGTAGSDAFAAGDGMLSAVIDGAPLQVTGVGATSGPDPADPTAALLTTVAALADGSAAMVVLRLDPSDLVLGTALPIDALAVSGLLYRYTAATGFALVGHLTGTMTPEQLSTDPGAPVQASFDAVIVRAPPEG